MRALAAAACAFLLFSCTDAAHVDNLRVYAEKAERDGSHIYTLVAPDASGWKYFFDVKSSTDLHIHPGDRVYLTKSFTIDGGAGIYYDNKYWGNPYSSPTPAPLDKTLQYYLDKYGKGGSPTPTPTPTPSPTPWQVPKPDNMGIIDEDIFLYGLFENMKHPIEMNRQL